MRRGEKYQKVCPECGDAFEAKKSDRVYCYDKDCKMEHNNDKAKIRRRETRMLVGTKATLWKNRKLLLQYVDQTIDIRALIAEGLKPNYLTFTVQPKGKSRIFVCYDMLYYYIDTSKIKILRDDRYLL